MNGAKLICASLEELGVSHVFGLPGTQNVLLYEALRTSGLRSISASDEGAAAFMATGYAKASGHVGVLTDYSRTRLRLCAGGYRRSATRFDTTALVDTPPGGQYAGVPAATNRPGGHGAAGGEALHASRAGGRTRPRAAGGTCGSLGRRAWAGAPRNCIRPARSRLPACRESGARRRRLPWMLGLWRRC